MIIKYVVLCFGLYFVPKNISGVEKVWAFTNTFLSYVITTILLFSLIKAKMVLFDLDLIYLKAI